MGLPRYGTKIGTTVGCCSSLLGRRFRPRERYNLLIVHAPGRSFGGQDLNGSLEKLLRSEIGNVLGFAMSAGRSLTLTFTIGNSDKIESAPFATFPVLYNGLALDVWKLCAHD